MSARRRAILLAVSMAAPIACEDEFVTQAAAREPTLSSLDYRFVMHSAGVATGTLALGSTARGRLEIIELDEPSLLVGSLAIDHMQLRSTGQVLATLGAGEWEFIARRTNDGTVDALWLAADMPTEAQSLTRFLVSQLQMTTPDIASTEEQTPAGLQQARYQHFSTPLLHTSVRMRCSPEGSPNHVRGATIFLEDKRGLTFVGSGEVTHTSIGDSPLVAFSVLIAVRKSVATVADDDLERLRTRIESLSANPPVPLVELPLGKDEMDAMRRDAESWESVRERLVSVGDNVDATLLGRAAAHLVADETLAAELQALATDSETPAKAAAAMFAALADCGSKPCQDALILALHHGDSIRMDVLAAFGRVPAPTAEMVDQLLALGESSDEITRSTTGIVLSRFAEMDPDGAAIRVARIVAGLEGCPEQLDRWFDLIGNAGLPASEALLRGCLDDDVPTARRALAARALRRIPGTDVTKILVRLAREDPSPELRHACLLALVSRDVREADLEPLVSAPLDAWQTSELNLLLDVLEIVSEPGPFQAQLLEVLARSSHEEVAKRALALENSND